MPLAAGSRLGPYEILAPIGAGGMGEVYRARDTRLGREVAIKVSAERFTERFEREARAVAALNHPNICTLHDVGPNYLVMELVEGESPKGPMPLDEALRVARQIADALEAAHEKGIVHRDLKPANIKIKPDGTVKVLDFGLALVSTPEAGATTENSPTLTIGPTQAGLILGTAGYMSPEQARGKAVDKRADIWAFGVVLYELLTGKRLFRGEDLTETLASIVKEQPNLDEAPVPVRRLLRKCLEKDPKKRLRDIGDAMLLLEETQAPIPTKKAWLSPAITAVLLAALALVSVLYLRQKAPASPELVRLQIPAPEKGLLGFPVLSPDGRRLAFRVTDADGRGYLVVREMESLEVRRLAEFGASPSPPFWSPDGRFIAFQSQGKLKKVAVSGGPVQVLCDAPPTYSDGAWSPAGVIIFGGDGVGLAQVSASGDAPSPLTTLDPVREEANHEHPSFLPDGRHFVYSRISARRPENTGVYLGSLDAKPKEQESTQLMARQSGVVYANGSGSDHGYLLFVREKSLMAQQFNPTTAKLIGDPVVIGEPVDSSNGAGLFSASATGALAYRGPARGEGFARLTWFDRQGRLVSVAGDLVYNTVSLSHDGGRAAADNSRAFADSSNLWLIQFPRGLGTQLTFGPGAPNSPVWSPDGSQVVYASRKDGPGDLYRKASSGAGEEEALFKSAQAKYPDDWSRDGRFLLFSSVDPKTKSDLWILPLSAGGTVAGMPTRFLRTDAYESEGVFSPDTRWIAYQSDESGMTEIYVRPFPAASGQWQISHGGGYQARWRSDGKELFYLSGEGQLMAVDIATSPSFQPGVAKTLFQTRIVGGGPTQVSHRWDVSADGQRFLINTVGPVSNSPPVTVVLNWEAGLKR